MMGYVLTNQNIYDWYMHNPNADASLIQSFRAAMTVPNGSQQQSPLSSPAQQNGIDNQTPMQQVNDSPMSQNAASQGQNVESSSDNESNNIDNTNGGDSLNNYSEPLGVSEDKKNKDDASFAAEIAIAAVSMAAAGGAVYALSKDD